MRAAAIPVRIDRRRARWAVVVGAVAFLVRPCGGQSLFDSPPTPGPAGQPARVRGLSDSAGQAGSLPPAGADGAPPASFTSPANRYGLNTGADASAPAAEDSAITPTPEAAAEPIEGSEII